MKSSKYCAFSGSLNVECAVLPPSKSVAAIPDEATANAIFPFDRTLAKIREITKVFPVPPGASRKYNPPDWLSIVSKTLLYTAFCSGVKRDILAARNVSNCCASYVISLRKSMSPIFWSDRIGEIIPTCKSVLL